MHLVDYEKNFILKYKELLEQNKVEEFLDAAHSLIPSDAHDMLFGFSRIFLWLKANNVPIKDNYEPTFTYYGSNSAKDKIGNKFIIQPGVSSIEATDFYHSKVQTIVIPEGVTIIDSAAFMACFRLNNITLPNSLKSIGAKAFQNCSALKNIDVPDSCLFIGPYAFAESGVQSITMNQIDIGRGCFYNCAELEEITINAMTNRISKSLNLFEGCDSLKKIHTRDRKLIAYVNKYYPNIEVVK